MTGVISITDSDWFQFLSAQKDLDEVNFWRPTDLRRPELAPGTPFIFKLNAKHGGRIVGYGIFARHTIMPMSLVWDAFERGNGAASFANLHRMLKRIRDEKGKASDVFGNFDIGCLMLSSPVFFAEEDWIRPPSDWPRTGVMQGKGYDLASGDGARVWNACLALTNARATVRSGAGLAAEPAAPRYGALSLVAPRLGQATFRLAVTDAYGRACAVTGEHSLPVLEAAHIRPYAEEGPHRVANGLLLRTDIHRLFDKGYVTITPDDLRFVVSKRLKEDYENGATYYGMNDRLIRTPRAGADRPSRDYLAWHVSERFRG